MEPPFIRLLPLVHILAQVLHPYLDMPFVFYGHSMGALISFELARQLRRQNSTGPVHLFVSSCRAPQLPVLGPLIHTLPDFTFVEKLRHPKGALEEMLKDVELMQLMLPTLRADLALCETYIYSPEAPLDCSISAFGGINDRTVTYSDLVAWRGQTRSSLTLRLFPGDHFFLNSAQALVLQTVSDDLTWILNQR
jgi:medium-chain acyl-[acyl-carrier-protein] hydrolase